MEKTCTKCSSKFTVDQDDQSFYQKMEVPVPTVCPDCRFKMRALFRNETTLYTGRKCDLCDKAVITMYNPKSPYKIYCYDCFYSDKWDAKDFAMDYDTSRSFLDQMKEFLIRVPKINTYASLGDGPNINSEYVNMASGCKNCYLVFNTSPAEELLYSRGIKYGKDSSDLYFGVTMERCYESINIQQSAGVIWGQNIVSCVDCIFAYNCSGLTNCFGSVNLRNKSNCWFNEQLTHEEYIARLKEVMGSYSKMEEMKKKFFEFKKSFPHRENNNIKTVGSTGDYLFECKNVRDSFENAKSEDCHYTFSSKEIKDSIGTIGYGTKCENVLEVVATGFSSNVIGTYGAEHSRDILYGYYISNCEDCIGCDALKHGKYSIFNKEYSKEEYEKLKEKIIAELTEAGLYGLMMPPELAPFAYNETIAQDNFPLTKEEVLKLGFRFEDDIQMTKGKETIQPDEIPDQIKDVQDSITKEVLKCIHCERNYKITEQELLFYKKMNLPIPRMCFYCRHQDRIRRRGPYKFWQRNCAHCNKQITTNYAPDRPEIVYCEQCYQQEVI
jgi:hypothetical protein